jgi:hypothetical protein
VDAEPLDMEGCLYFQCKYASLDNKEDTMTAAVNVIAVMLSLPIQTTTDVWLLVIETLKDITVDDCDILWF